MVDLQALSASLERLEREVVSGGIKTTHEVQAGAALVQATALLAVAEQQRIANLIAYSQYFGQGSLQAEIAEGLGI